MKNRKVLFITLFVVFLAIVLYFLFDMANRTTARWTKKGGLNKYRNTIEQKRE